MTCGLHTKFDKAVDAVKEALHAAIDTKDFNRSTLSELWRHYQGLQTISEGLPEHKEHDSITFDTKNVPGFESDYTPGIFPDGCYDPDYNINLFNNDPLSGNIEFGAAAPAVVTFGGAGEDVLNFSTSGTDTVTVPEHEDDEKIVL